MRGFLVKCLPQEVCFRFEVCIAQGPGSGDEIRHGSAKVCLATSGFDIGHDVVTCCFEDVHQVVQILDLGALDQQFVSADAALDGQRLGLIMTLPVAPLAVATWTTGTRVRLERCPTPPTPLLF